MHICNILWCGERHSQRCEHRVRKERQSGESGLKGMEVKDQSEGPDGNFGTEKAVMCHKSHKKKGWAVECCASNSLSLQLLQIRKKKCVSCLCELDLCLGAY